MAKVDDLLPLFLDEARDRLERLSLSASKVEQDPETARSARRELHALKGASRMMKLGELSQLCHEAEDLLTSPGEGTAATLLAMIDRLEGMIGKLADSESGADSAADDGSAVCTNDSGPQKHDETETAEAAAAATELRVRTDVLDRLADQGANLRVLAVGGHGFVDRVFQLAQLAERGVGEQQPQQVLSALSASLRQTALELERTQRSMHRLAEGQLEVLVGLQVQPLRPFLLGLARHARDLAEQLGKEVDVTSDAGDSQLDRRLLGALREAFLHLVRNAVDHGIEAPQERLASGKPARGTIRILATPEGNRVKVELRDDGRGIDAKQVAAAVRRRGLLSEEELAAREGDHLLQLLFLPGLSTREEASAVSGRGIGLDAVAEAVRGIGGDAWITSSPGRGTTVVLEVPMARRGERVLVLKVGENRVAMPAAPVRSFRRIDSSMVTTENGSQAIVLEDRVLRPVFLSALLGEGLTTEGVLVEGLAAGVPLSIVADGVIGDEEVVLRPLSPVAGAPPVFDSSALLASGRPVPVLSIHRLLQAEVQRSGVAMSQRSAASVVRVLLVDDSAVTREMIRRLLEDSGFAVTAVGAADDALRMMSEREFDCLVTDIEMPGMDGLQLTRRLRDTPQHAHLPVVVVSTRDRAEDRLAGLEAGADAYLTKQGLDARELASVVRRVGGRA